MRRDNSRIDGISEEASNNKNKLKNTEIGDSEKP
jgi:hypothetical protein